MTSRKAKADILKGRWQDWKYKYDKKHGPREPGSPEMNFLKEQPNITDELRYMRVKIIIYIPWVIQWFKLEKKYTIKSYQPTWKTNVSKVETL